MDSTDQVQPAGPALPWAAVAPATPLVDLEGVPDAVHAALARHVDEAQRVELVPTAGRYATVPRAFDALRVPVAGTGETR